jgi:hypothetical protein
MSAETKQRAIAGGHERGRGNTGGLSMKKARKMLKKGAGKFTPEKTPEDEYRSGVQLVRDAIMYWWR